MERNIMNKISMSQKNTPDSKNYPDKMAFLQFSDSDKFQFLTKVNYATEFDIPRRHQKKDKKINKINKK